MLLPDEHGTYTLEGDISPEAIQSLLCVGPIGELLLTRIPLVTVKLAKRMASLQVKRLWIRGDVTRCAMRHIIPLPGLRYLNVSCMTSAAQLANFSKADCLEGFRSDLGMTEQDLLQVTQCASLRDLGAQNAALSPAVVSAIVSMPHLTTLDVEGTRFDDKMAKQISRSKTITSLHLGATRMTRAGLECLMLMEQLHALDLWALALNEKDLERLLDLPNLEFISLGGDAHAPPLDPRAVTALILACPSLRHVWLDGVELLAGQRQALEAKLAWLRIT